MIDHSDRLSLSLSIKTTLVAEDIIPNGLIMVAS